MEAEKQQSPETGDAITRAMNAIRGIVRAMRMNTRAIELQLGISLAQLFVLEQLEERSASSLNELAARTATHQSSVSVVVRRLVDRGLVSRMPSQRDRRRIELALTPAGRALLADAPVTIQARLVTGLRQIPVNDRAMLAELLDRWMAGADINTAAPPMLGEDDTA
jgi:DNA-binding MarR family transcriptional regulator